MREDASIYALAHTEWIEPGEWHPPATANGAGSLGLLVLDGFLVRHVRVIDRPPAELLGPGDLLHPWEPDHTEPFVAGARWDVLEPARVAVLDRRFAAGVGPRPGPGPGALRRAGAPPPPPLPPPPLGPAPR